MGFIQEDCGCVYHSDGFNNDHEITEQCLFHQGLKLVKHPAVPPAEQRRLWCRLHLHPVDGCPRCGFKHASIEYVRLSEQEKEQGRANLLAAWKQKHDAGESHGRWLT